VKNPQVYDKKKGGLGEKIHHHKKRVWLPLEDVTTEPGSCYLNPLLLSTPWMTCIILKEL
jgi:hypothetical protein